MGTCEETSLKLDKLVPLSDKNNFFFFFFEKPSLNHLLCELSCEGQRPDITISLYQLENSMVHYMFHD